MITVLASGFFTTIQDLGRYGFRKFGVPQSGTLDQRSAILANALLGNDEESAVLEATMIGPSLVFECNTSIAVTGAEMNASINDAPISNNIQYPIKKGDVLSFKKLDKGYRAYIAVVGGINVPKVLNSRSFYNSITPQYKLEKGQILTIQETNSSAFHKNVKVGGIDFENEVLNVFKGPEYECLNPEQKVRLGKKFSIGVNNRMAYYLNETIPNKINQILTSGVIPGTVQLPPSGKLILLMNDCQTTGGYPRILQLSKEALNTLAQKKLGDSVQFKLID